jgi:hypothetical protein
MPAAGINFASTLGWSSVKQSLMLSILALASTHFDFIINHEVIISMLGALSELLPLQKELEPEVRHSSDHETLLSLKDQLTWLTGFVADLKRQREPEIGHSSDREALLSLKDQLTSLTSFVADLKKQREPEIGYPSDHEALLSLKEQVTLLSNFVMQQSQGHGQEEKLPAVYGHSHGGVLLYSSTTGAQTQNVVTSAIVKK